MANRWQELLATPQIDPVREWCRQRRYADFVILGGLDGMVERWEYRVACLATHERMRGYVIEEFQIDLDGRRILDELFPLASDEQQDAVHNRIAAADAYFREVTFESVECVWGSAVAERRGYRPDSHWFYFRWPRHIGERWRGYPMSEKLSRSR